MKLFISTIAALSIAAATATVAGINPSGVGASIDAASPPVQPNQLLLAQKRGKCQEDLGYGRTGSYCCG